MSLRVRLTEDMKVAMKAKDSLKLSVVRLLLSAVKNREIEQKKELDDQGIVEVAGALVKQRKDSIRLFRDAGREDLAVKEESELSFLLEYLPVQLSRGEIEALVVTAIAESGAQGVKEIGKVMKCLMPHTTGRADGKLVNEIVREKLA